MEWLDILKECSQRMRKDVLPFFGSRDAGIGFGTGAGGDVMKKIDLVAEKALIDVLEDHEVSCTLISEETGTKRIGTQPSDFYLTTDPVDGTTNAVRGLPFMATSIAVSRTPYLHDVEMALVSDLFHNITYTARRNKGAYRNEKRIKPSKTSSLEEAVVGVDFNTLRLGELVASLEGMLIRTRHLRHLGANALEICYVADGTTDAFIDIRGKLRVTDMAAAYLILLEAGGIMVTPEGTELNVPLAATQRVSFIAAANTKLYETIRSLLA
jgi:myo-inositol-1(or 4)-monophosphatase